MTVKIFSMAYQSEALHVPLHKTYQAFPPRFIIRLEPYKFLPTGFPYKAHHLSEDHQGPHNKLTRPSFQG